MFFKNQIKGIKKCILQTIVYLLSTAFLTALVVFLIFLGSYLFSYLGMLGIWLIAALVAICTVLAAKSFFKKTKDLEETKTTLEIRVKARTRELEELAISLEEKVKERTKELQERLEELEKIHRLTVGRELKMIELKEEIAKLKAKVESYDREAKKNKISRRGGKTKHEKRRT